MRAMGQEIKNACAARPKKISPGIKLSSKDTFLHPKATITLEICFIAVAKTRSKIDKWLVS
jgi:hypothetical protein